MRSIARGYDTLGRVAKITSHGNQTDDPDDTTNIENQVVYTYNDLGQVTKSKQSHSGAVNGTTPNVQYAYDSSATTSVFDDGARMESVTYPDGRILFSDYGTADGFEDRTGTVRRLRETDSTGAILADYSGTGAGAVVLTDYQQPDLKLDLFGGTSGTYAGLDRFRRTIDHRWYDYTSGTVDVARYKYSYDNNSSRTWKEDTVAASNTVDQDEFYTYDGLNRLKAADRGNLNAGKTAISTLSFGQDWDQDQLGNWSGFTEDSNGNATNDLDQSRTHNDANEITDVTETTGPAWVTPAHDAAGNMTTVPQPAAPASSYTLTWDAWNRLVKVANGATTVAEYSWDGSNHRIIRKTYAAGVLDETRHIYLSQSNQVLEERVDASTSADRQFTWGTRYIDDLVLRTRDTDANGTLDETVYALQDANWNITALTDTSGAVVERFKYTSYGQSTVLDANFTADADGISDYAWEYRFTSREYDSETALHYFRARFYHSGMGRFVGRDPLGFVDGASLYAAYFVPNSTDPTGYKIVETGRPNGHGTNRCAFILYRRGKVEAIFKYPCSSELERQIARKKALMCQFDPKTCPAPRKPIDSPPPPPIVSCDPCLEMFLAYEAGVTLGTMACLLEVAELQAHSPGIDPRIITALAVECTVVGTIAAAAGVLAFEECKRTGKWKWFTTPPGLF